MMWYSNEVLCIGSPTDKKQCFLVCFYINKGLFLQTRKSAAWLASQLTQDGHMVGMLSGELDISQRADIIQRFKRGHEKVLITTNVSARGTLKAHSVVLHTQFFELNCEFFELK